MADAPNKSRQCLREEVLFLRGEVALLQDEVDALRKYWNQTLDAYDITARALQTQLQRNRQLERQLLGLKADKKEAASRP